MIATVPGEPFIQLQLDWTKKVEAAHPFLFGYTWSEGTWPNYLPDIKSAALGGYGADQISPKMIESRLRRSHYEQASRERFHVIRTHAPATGSSRIHTRSSVDTDASPPEIHPRAHELNRAHTFVFSTFFCLFVLPTNQLSAPLTSVAVSTLSRLDPNSTQYRHYFLRTRNAFLMLSIDLIISNAADKSKVDT